MVHHHQPNHLHPRRGFHDRCFWDRRCWTSVHRPTAHRLGCRSLLNDHTHLRGRVQSRSYPWASDRSLRSRCAVWNNGMFNLVFAAPLADGQVGFWIPYAVLQTQKGTIQWRLPFALQLIPAVGCLIAIVFLKESPRFTAKKFGAERGIFLDLSARFLADPQLRPILPTSAVYRKTTRTSALSYRRSASRSSMKRPRPDHSTSSRLSSGLSARPTPERSSPAYSLWSSSKWPAPTLSTTTLPLFSKASGCRLPLPR
jgi:MFS family permease